MARRAVAPYQLPAVAADGVDRATFFCFVTERFFLGTLGLFVNEGMAAVVVALEVCGRRFTTQIAVDALVIDVKFPVYILRIFVCNVSHFRLSKISRARLGRNTFYAMDICSEKMGATGDEPTREEWVPVA